MAMKPSNGREVYIFVRKYQRALEDLCVNVE